jgi:hypothetical protein
MGYPKWKYHATKDPVVVESKEAEADLGEGWGESPAEFSAPKDESPVASPSEEPKPKYSKSKNSKGSAEA